MIHELQPVSVNYQMIIILDATTIKKTIIYIKFLNMLHIFMVFPSFLNKVHTRALRSIMLRNDTNIF